MRASIFPRAFLVVLCTACSDSTGICTEDRCPANEFTIEMRDNNFNPTPATISAGTTVRWRNAGTVQHNTISSTAGLWTSGNLNPGSTFPRQFDTVGTFAYTCTLHAGMAGTIIVQ